MNMTETIDATPAAFDHPVPLDAASAPFMAPPALSQPAPSMPPPPPSALAAPALPTLVAAPPAPLLAAPAPVAAPVAATPVAEPTTEALAPAPSKPAMTTGPSAIFSADATVIPLEPAVPMLPTNTPVVPSGSTTPASASVFDVQEFLGTASPTRKAPAKSPGRWLVRLLLVGLLGAGGYAAQQYGPDLYEQYTGDGEEAGPAEPTAPLAFPNVPTSTAPIRTAEFVLVGLPETPGATYRVTTDFETNVSQVDITRENGPDLQILTYGNDAMIRRADGEQWYLLDRGQFPLDGRLERADWVRRLDELLPSTVRDQATVDASTESTMTGAPTRHLSITVDPVLLDSMTIDSADVPSVAAPEALPDPATDGAAPPVAPVEPGAAASSTTELATAPATGMIEIEIWVDGDGLVRQVSGAPQLGAEMITVVRTSADAWIPNYPEPGEIATLTASALVDLGL